MPSIRRKPGMSGRSGTGPLELRLVDADILDADAGLVAPRLDHPVDHQKWIAVRQGFQQAQNVKRFDRYRHCLVHSAPLSLAPNSRPIVHAALRTAPTAAAFKAIAEILEVRHRSFGALSRE